MALQQEVLDLLVREVADLEEIYDPQVQIYKGSSKGDGYVTVTKSLEIAGKNKTVHLFIKIAPSGVMMRKSGMIQAVFAQEILFYEKLMPTLIEYQIDNNIQNSFMSVPKPFWCCSEEGKEVIALENLKIAGYELWDRQKAMNREHIKFLFKEYAKFHGISYAMKYKDHDGFENLTSDIKDLYAVFVDIIKFDEFVEKSCKDLINIFDEVNDRDKHDWYANFVRNVRKHYKDVLKIDEKCVITHGDCWSNNMLFKYKDNDYTVPESMRLLDFQLVRKVSPVQDLCYIFYSGASNEILENYEYYLRLYHRYLMEYLRQYKITEEVISYEDLLDQWKKYSKFGLIMSIIVIKVKLTESDERNDMNDGTDSVFDCFNFVGKKDHEYKRRIKMILEHFYKNNLISPLSN